MSARAVAARYEGCFSILDRPKRLRNVPHALDAGGIALRPNQHEVVVHHGKSFDAFAFGNELQFSYFGVYEHNIGLATPASIECLAGPQALSRQCRSSA